MAQELETYSNSKPGFDLVTYATFHEETSVGLHDPYGKRTEELPRHKNKQFITNGPSCPEKGLAASQLGTAIPFTVPGDRYVESSKLQADLARRSAGANISKPFVPSSGRVLTGGPGALIGAFGPPNLLVDTDTSASRRPSTAPLAGLRNLYVNPPHKGGPGRMVQDNTIGGTAFKYVPDEYCRGRRLEKVLRREARARIAKPFISAGGPPRTFKEVPGLAATGNDPYTLARARSAPPKTQMAWRPNNPAPQGQGYGIISRIEYLPNGTRRPPHDGRYTRPFVPSGGPHSRLSMWTVNPYTQDARPPPDNDLSLI